MLTHVCNLLRDMNSDNYKKNELQKRISNRNNFDIQIFCNHMNSYSFIFIAHIFDESKFYKSIKSLFLFAIDQFFKRIQMIWSENKM